MGAAAIPIISTVAGMIGQNVQNKHNIAAAEGAQNNAMNQNQAALQQALASLGAWNKANPNPASTWGNLMVPGSFGGGVTTGGINPLMPSQGSPQGGYNPMIAQMLQGMLSGGQQPQGQPPGAILRMGQPGPYGGSGNANAPNSGVGQIRSPQ